MRITISNARHRLENHHRASRSRRPSARLAGLLLVMAAMAVPLIMPTAPTAQAAEVTLLATLTVGAGPSLPLSSASPVGGLMFTTGDNPAGYDLSSVGVVFGEKTDPPDSEAENLTITAKLYKDPSVSDVFLELNLGAEVEECALTVPASITENIPTGRAPTSFAAPDSCPALEAETDYAVAIERDSSSNMDIEIQRTADTRFVDDGAASGWSAGLGYLSSATPSSQFLSKHSNLRFEIKGTAINTEATARRASTALLRWAACSPPARRASTTQTGCPLSSRTSGCAAAPTSTARPPCTTTCRTRMWTRR